MSLGEDTFAWHCKLHNLTPEREYRFHPKRRWRFDFAWPDPKIMLAVEIHGGTWSQGRHTRGKGFAEDCLKMNTAALMGWTVMVFSSEMVTSGNAIDTVRAFLLTRNAM